MRVCSIITSFTSGGAETLVCNLSRAFSARGHDTTIVSLCDAATVGNPVETEQRTIDRVETDGVRTRKLSLVSRHNPFAGAKQLRRVLREVRPDIVHAHTARAALMLLLVRPGVPIILTHHNSRLSFPPALFRIFDRLVHSYVAISDECAVRTERFARRNVRLIVNAADASFRSEAPRDEPSQHPVLLSVGNLFEQKNYPLLIRTAAILAPLLREQGRTVRIEIAGHGKLMPELQKLIEAEGMDGIVALLGARGDVEQLMRKADLFINTSHYEGLPVAMIEAMMSALPIIATDVPGNRELVRPENGILVAPDDPQAFAKEIARLLLDPKRYALLSRGSIAQGARFSIETCVDEHLKLYAEALAER